MTRLQSVAPASLALAPSQAFAVGRRRALARFAVLPALLASALAGCGQKGPLVLPPAAAASAPAPATPPATSAAPAR